MSDGMDYLLGVFESTLLRSGQWRTDCHRYDHVIWVFLFQNGQALG